MTPPRLLLLALVALLVFGSCGGGVAGMLRGLGAKHRATLRGILAQNDYLHARARQQLRGPARRDEDERVERLTNARLDSLLGADTPDHRKLLNRRRKVERQLRQRPG